jgi:hypothetical protein
LTLKAVELMKIFSTGAGNFHYTVQLHVSDWADSQKIKKSTLPSRPSKCDAKNEFLTLVTRTAGFGNRV